MTKPEKTLTRRAVLGASTVAFAAPFIVKGKEPGQVLGQGDYRYRVVPDWGKLDGKTPVKNCQGIVCTRDKHVILLTDHVANNVIVYDRAGKLVHKWGAEFPGAHGLSIVREGDVEVLFLTDTQRHSVTKTSLDGKVLERWAHPPYPKQYDTAKGYRPSWTLHDRDGSFYVLDGYGKDYIIKYGKDGKSRAIFGGPEGGIVHWGPHGGMIDHQPGKASTLLIAMSDQQYLLRLSLEGRELARYPIPGGNPRQLRLQGDYYVLPHLADNWPKDRSSRGFVSILDRDLRIVSNIAGTPPVYHAEGELAKMRHTENVFMHPHDAVADTDHSIYVAEALSGSTYPVKLERV